MNEAADGETGPLQGEGATGEEGEEEELAEDTAGVPFRPMGAARDARKIAEALLKGGAVPLPRRRSISRNELIFRYAEALVFESLYRLEEILKRKKIPGREVIGILEAARGHLEWAAARMRPKTIRQRVKQGSPKQAVPAPVFPSLERLVRGDGQ